MADLRGRDFHVDDPEHLNVLSWLKTAAGEGIMDRPPKETELRPRSRGGVVGTTPSDSSLVSERVAYGFHVPRSPDARCEKRPRLEEPKEPHETHGAGRQKALSVKVPDRARKSRLAASHKLLENFTSPSILSDRIAVSCRLFDSLPYPANQG